MSIIVFIIHSFSAFVLIDQLQNSKKQHNYIFVMTVKKTTLKPKTLPPVVSSDRLQSSINQAHTDSGPTPSSINLESSVVGAQRHETTHDGKGGKFSRAANALRRAAKQMVLADRFESLVPTDPSKKPRRRHAAPFSLVSPYQTVRGLLDPIRDRHLLGTDTLATARSGGTDTDHVKTPRATLQVSGSFNELGSDDDDDAFEPDNEVSLDSVLVPLDAPRRVPSATLRRRSLKKTRPASELAAASLDENSHPAEPETLRAALPDGREIALLPPELALTFFTVAMDKFRKLLLPKVLLVLQKRRNKALEREMISRTTRPSAETFKKFKLFNLWTAEALQLATESLTYKCVDANRFIWYTGEPGGTMGIVLLSHGTCRSLRNAQRLSGEKRLRQSSTIVLSTHNPGHMFNEYSFVTQEPQMRYVKSATRCDLWCMSREAFEACVQLLPESTRAAMAQLAFARRQKMIPEAYAFHPQLLKKSCPTFSRNSDTVLTLIVQAMKPLAVHANTVLAREGETPHCMYFLRRGKVGAFQVVNGEMTHVRSIYAPATLLESCVLHRQENVDLLRAISECDFLTVTLDDIQSIMSQYPAERDILLEVSREEKMKILSKQQLRFRPLLFKVPIVRHVLEAEQITTLSHLFEGRVYSSMELIVSKSEMCDRVIILTKGQVSFGKKGPVWDVGEAMGFTCLIPHRWAHSVVAVQQCECIELRRELLVAFFQDCSVLQDATDVCEFVLCPEKFKLFEQERLLAEKGIAMTPALRQLHKAGRLSPARHRSVSSLAASPSPSPAPSGTAPPSSIGSYYQQQHLKTPAQVAAQKHKARLSGVVQSVLYDVEAMVCPPMFPTSNSLEGVVGGSVEPGFVPCRSQFKTTELAVAGGLYAPTLREEDREEALAAAMFNHRRDPVRRVAKITPYLMVKQR